MTNTATQNDYYTPNDMTLFLNQPQTDTIINETHLIFEAEIQLNAGTSIVIYITNKHPLIYRKLKVYILFLDGGGYFGEWYSAGLFTEVAAFSF